MMTVELGRTYRDRITGFKGVCTGRVNYISGCDQALLAMRVGKDGTLKTPEWFDVQRLESVGAAPVVLDNTRTPGHDVSAPRR